MTEILLQLAGEVVKVETRRNRALRITFDSQEEVMPEVRSKLMNCVERLGWLSFLPTTERMIDPLDIAGLPAIRPEDGTKTPAQRLRAVLHIAWDQGGKKGTSEDYYREAMEKIINHYKEKLV